jgi:tetratricopeptide (TPR) repeat protein
MRNKLQLMFGLAFVALVSLTANGQGIGDRNRAADSQGGNYSIAGRVVLPDGKPAAHLKVTITSADGPGTSAITDDDGAFQTGNVSAGNYTITARADGVPAANEYLTIGRDDPVGRTFSIVLYMRNPGQKKGDIYSANPMFKEVPKGAMDTFLKAMDKMHANDSKGAIPLFDSAIAAYPNFAPAYYELGSAYLKTNDLDKALESFVKAIQVKPDYTEAKYSVGYTQYLKGNFEVAAAVFDDVIKIKDTPDAQLYLGVSLARLHNVDAAVPHLKAALAKKDDESTALAHRYLGGIYMQKQQNAEAAAELQRFLTLVPKAPDAEKLKATIANLKKTS